LATEFGFDKSFIDNKLGKFLVEIHPTPAVCGFPKEKALDLIFDIEKHNREYYSGFMGTVNVENATNLFVNLRCMKILPEKLALFTGGGITGDSIPEKEWEQHDLYLWRIRSDLSPCFCRNKYCSWCNFFMTI